LRKKQENSKFETGVKSILKQVSVFLLLFSFTFPDGCQFSERSKVIIQIKCQKSELKEKLKFLNLNVAKSGS
jgi:hypothetical protein